MRTFMRGRPTRHKPGTMNKTEAEYAGILEVRKRVGEIADYWFECFTFKLAQDCRLTPDFVVMMPDGVLELHEVKGFWEGDAIVKAKVAAEKFPFRFIAVSKRAKKHGGGWNVREF